MHSVHSLCIFIRLVVFNELRLVHFPSVVILANHLVAHQGFNLTVAFKLLMA